MLPNITAKWRIRKYNSSGAASLQEDDIATEYPLTIRLDGEDFATIVCSPTDLEEMTVGFLASEGIIRQAAEIESLRIDEERGFVYVELFNKQSTSKDDVSKRFIGSCCGKSRQFYFHNDARTARTSMSRMVLTPSQCIALMRLLQSSSGEFKLTGGVHNAALCTADELLAVRTDIGRHNALDKLFGYALRQRLAVTDKIIAFSGRLSSEVVLKAAKIGVGILLSKSAPTDLALKLAEDLGITCAGFIRGSEMNVYTHGHRIVDDGVEEHKSEER
ncbi:formate dehydrogenase accessory sulfurtransferase FdhD [Paenibacillus montanisoli]|uniref:Sulfur carrier protein FdhD n=1 Tax=Paenibacillus montanisoli TaxID=2081970 RepID=A0A328U4R0_9BACL|nr:formate dehydrogenase accessory sulfurtransferase FdhD [Paenibacillus montanisoli]RAP74866.1 formate dehydrogenase accessory sulfurtransferase FdhD [Paenibacillus montanisoli]